VSGEIISAFATPRTSASGSNAMTASEQKTDLLRAMGKLVRGLSALFWGLPLTLVTYVQTARTDWLDPLEWGAMVPAIAVTALLFYGLWQMHSFQRQERIWIRALDRAEILAFINIGLSPFIYWWHRVPEVMVYQIAVTLLAISSIVFLYNLNNVLERLTAMLPDETLRLETKMFTGFNRSLLFGVPVLVILYVVLARFEYLSGFISHLVAVGERVGVWFILFLLLMPLAMTMTLIWKIKEVIFNSIFDANR
jgi:hypothetical protein